MPNSLPSNGTHATEKQFDELVDEITRRLQADEPIEMEHYIGQAGPWGDRLRQMWPGLVALAELGHSRDPQDLSIGDVRGFSPTLNGNLGDFRLIREIG